MDKLEQLLLMAEHPEQYTDEQIEKLLADKEARAYYELMATARSGFEYRKSSQAAHNTESSSSQHLSSNTQYQSPNTNHQSPNTNHQSLTTQHPIWRRVAAVVAVLLVISGLALAAIFMERRQQPAPPANTQQPSPITHHPAAVTPLAPQPEPQQVLFEDAELQTILQQVGEYYQKKVVFSNDSTRHIRLYIKWNQAESANEMIERLNNFEKVNIKLDGNNIISE